MNCNEQYFVEMRFFNCSLFQSAERLRMTAIWCSQCAKSRFVLNFCLTSLLDGLWSHRGCPFSPGKLSFLSPVNRKETNAGALIFSALMFHIHFDASKLSTIVWLHFPSLSFKSLSKRKDLYFELCWKRVIFFAYDNAAWYLLSVITTKLK